MRDRHTIKYAVGDLLFEFTSQAGFKGDLTAVADEQPLTLKIDLNSRDGRSKFIAEAYDLYPEAFALEELDFRRALNALATHVDEEYKIRAAKAEEGEDDNEVESFDVDEEKAEALISTPGVLDRFIEDMARIFDVHEDRAQMKVVTLGALSAQLKPLSGGTPVGTNVMLIGEAGRGKNYISDAVASGMPRSFVYEFESASAKSFYYGADTKPERFKHTWVYPNEAEATDTLVETLRPLLSKAKATHNTVDTDGEGANAFRELTIEGPITVTIPTVRNKLDGQLQSRMLVIELEEFEDRVPKHSSKVSESLVLKRALEDHAGELDLWRAALTKLTDVRRVGIVAHDDRFRLETNKISHGARLWRNFLSLMLTYAWLEQNNREVVTLENGEKGVYVTSEDYRVAYQIFSVACKRSVVELSDTHRKILNATYRLERSGKRTKLRGAGFPLRAIAEVAGISHETVRKQQTFLVESVGLLRKPDEGGLRLVKEADPSWWVEYDLLEGFPTPDQVKKWWEDENTVDTVDKGENEGEKPIDKPNTVSTVPVDKRVDTSTPTDDAADAGVDTSTSASTGTVDNEKPIGKPKTNGKDSVSTVSTLFEGLGEKVDYGYTEDE